LISQTSKFQLLIEKFPASPNLFVDVLVETPIFVAKNACPLPRIAFSSTENCSFNQSTLLLLHKRGAAVAAGKKRLPLLRRISAAANRGQESLLVSLRLLRRWLHSPPPASGKGLVSQRAKRPATYLAEKARIQVAENSGPARQPHTLLCRNSK